jgi:hypothetical protein
MRKVILFIPFGIPALKIFFFISFDWVKKKYFESRNTKGYKQNNIPHVHSKSKLIKKNIERAGIPKGINRITFLMNAQSQN